MNIRDGKYQTVATVELQIKLEESDIFDWLNDCSDPQVLKRLGRAALRFAEALENPDDDDFRSRA